MTPGLRGSRGTPALPVAGSLTYGQGRPRSCSHGHSLEALQGDNCRGAAGPPQEKGTPAPTPLLRPLALSRPQEWGHRAACHTGPATANLGTWCRRPQSQSHGCTQRGGGTDAGQMGAGWKLPGAARPQWDVYRVSCGVMEGSRSRCQGLWHDHVNRAPGETPSACPEGLVWGRHPALPLPLSAASPGQSPAVAMSRGRRGRLCLHSATLAQQSRRNAEHAARDAPNGHIVLVPVPSRSESLSGRHECRLCLAAGWDAGLGAAPRQDRRCQQSQGRWGTERPPPAPAAASPLVGEGRAIQTQLIHARPCPPLRSHPAPTGAL